MILAHVLRIPDILQAAGPAIVRLEFFEEPHGWMNAAVEVALMLKTAKCEVSLETVKQELAVKMQNDNHARSVIDPVLLYLPSIYRKDIQTPAYIKHLLQKEIREKEVALFTSDFATAADMDRVVELNRELNRVLTQGLFAEVEAIDLFAPENRVKYLSAAMPKPINVDYVDELLGGGMCDGEMIGMLAPSGGGKTTFSLQCFVSLSMKEQAAYISCEQKPAGDLMQRISSLLTGAPKTSFGIVGNGLNASSEQAFSQAEERIERFRQNGVFIDATRQDIRSIDDLMRPIMEKISAGFRPRAVFLDWWGRIRSTLLRNNKFKSESEERRMSSDWLMQLKRYCDPVEDGGTGANIIITHQLSGEAASRSPGKISSSHDAQEDKSFNNMFDFVLVAGAKDHGTKEVKWIAGKSRSRDNVEVRTRLDGLRCRFVLMSETDIDRMEDERRQSAIITRPGARAAPASLTGPKLPEVLTQLRKNTGRM